MAQANVNSSSARSRWSFRSGRALDVIGPLHLSVGQDDLTEIWNNLEEGADQSDSTPSWGQDSFRMSRPLPGTWRKCATGLRPGSTHLRPRFPTRGRLAFSPFAFLLTEPARKQRSLHRDNGFALRLRIFFGILFREPVSTLYTALAYELRASRHDISKTDASARMVLPT
jgi:hypothetical protein